MTSTRAQFISFEGIDGAGKSTHIAMLADALRTAGHAVVLTREPGGTPLAERLRELALHQPMSALTEALLMFAARRDHLDVVIEPALAAGQCVLCDRFTDATFAYQGAGRGFDWETLSMLERMVQTQAGQSTTAVPLREPDLTLWFDLEPAQAAQRLAQARVPDRFEAQPQAFFEAVRSGYTRRMAQAPNRIVRIDSGQPLAQVREQVLQVARQRGLITETAAQQALARAQHPPAQPAGVQ